MDEHFDDDLAYIQEDDLINSEIERLEIENEIFIDRHLDSSEKTEVDKEIEEDFSNKLRKPKYAWWWRYFKD